MHIEIDIIYMICKGIKFSRVTAISLLFPYVIYFVLASHSRCQHEEIPSNKPQNLNQPFPLYIILHPVPLGCITHTGMQAHRISYFYQQMYMQRVDTFFPILVSFTSKTLSEQSVHCP